jgi:hypothetical protein
MPMCVSPRSFGLDQITATFFIFSSSLARFSPGLWEVLYHMGSGAGNAILQYHHISIL